MYGIPYMDPMGHDLTILSQICDPQTVFTATVLRNWFIVDCLRRISVDDIFYCNLYKRHFKTVKMQHIQPQLCSQDS